MLHALNALHPFHFLAWLRFASLRRLTLLFLLGRGRSRGLVLHSLHPRHAFHLVALRFGAGLRGLGLRTLQSGTRCVGSMLSFLFLRLLGTRRRWGMLCHRAIVLLSRIRLRTHR